MWLANSLELCHTDHQLGCLRYFEDLDKTTEMWAAQIFEPIRKSYFCPPGQPPIRFLLRPEPAKEDATTITMVAVHPDKHGAWKEVVITKSSSTVQCYEIVSHGRRFYRTLQYCNDRRYALRCLMPDMTQIRKSAWPDWERHGGGHPLAVRSASDTSAVITRAWGVAGRHSRNLSGGVETYVPDRLLFGVLPEALLDAKLAKDHKDRVKLYDRWEWWQGEDDTLRGYPVSEDQQHILVASLESVEVVDCVKVQGTGARVRRLSRFKVEREYSEVIKLCEQIISCALLTESALGAMETGETQKKKDEQTDKKQKKKEADGAVYSESAPVSFELFNFVQSLVHEFGCKRLTSLIEELANGGASVEERVFETRRLLRKAIETAAAEGIAGTVTEHDSAVVSLLDEDMDLLDSLYSEKDGRRHSVAKVISRLDNIAHVLCWSRTCTEGDTVDVVELPRLSLTFVATTDDAGKVRLESSDHAGLFIHTAAFGLDRQTTEMLRGMPQSLVLTDSNGQHTILCAAVPLLRPVIPADPFSTELVLDRHRLNDDRQRKWVDGRSWAKRVPGYFLYPVHVSKTFLLHRSLASALYLLVLRFLARNYEATFALADAIATDKSYNKAERCIFMYVAEALFDQHPDAVSCRLRITHSVSAVPKVKELIPWDTTTAMARLVLSRQSISAATRMLPRDLLQLLKLCCTSVTDDEFSVKKGHTEYKCALVKNYQALLSAEMGEDMTLQLPERSSGSGWPFYNNTLVYALDKHSPSGQNIEALRVPSALSPLLAKETGELLVLLVHEQPMDQVSDAIQKMMIHMSTDRKYHTVIFRHLSRALLEDDDVMQEKLALKATAPTVVFYKLDEDDYVIDASLVGTKIKAHKQALGFDHFSPSKQYDAEVVAVNEDGSLHLRYDDEVMEDMNAPASLTDFGRSAADKTDQFVATSGQSPDTAVASVTKMVERLMDEPQVSAHALYLLHQPSLHSPA
jgi:hypothetical protein